MYLLLTNERDLQQAKLLNVIVKFMLVLDEHNIPSLSFSKDWILFQNQFYSLQSLEQLSLVIVPGLLHMRYRKTKYKE